MPSRRTLGQFFAPIVTGALSLTLLAWNAWAQDRDAQLAACREHGAAALRALQEKDLAAALKSLGAAADLSPGIHPSENDGLTAAAGGLHHALMQLGSDEQFDLLYAWSMPTESRSAIRVLTTLVPQDGPPKEFARALGERPRDNSFAISEIGGVRGLFSTGWTLAQAAEGSGRLRRLITELERLVEKETPQAEVLLLLAKLADRRGDTTEIADRLRQRLVAFQASSTEQAAARQLLDSSDIALAAASLTHEELRLLSEEIFKRLAEGTYGSSATRLRPFLRAAHAVATQLQYGESGPEAVYSNRLKHWIPATGKTAERNAAGAVDAMWLVHEEHILHLAGAGNDVLFLRYPLTGEFDFTCETQVGGEIGTEGGLTYGGLHFEALGMPEQLTVWDADLAHLVRRPCPFVRHEKRPLFNRVSIRSTENGAKFAANLHPIWSDTAASKASPWIGLRSFGESRPIFRNLKLTGKPVIPRQVRMSDGDHLRGWQSHFLAETQPPFSVQAPPSKPNAAGTDDSEAGFDWSLQAGVIHAARREAPQGGVLQSLLRYQRPLLDGESVSYEFHYQAGEYELHPALGRLAFLIEPGGVRIHWITDGELDWTGLPADNQAAEPLNRRGPRPLPLKENSWNQVALARAEGKVAISLNGELIYQRPVDFGGDHTFGLYRDAAKAAVRVRNVVMTGDWPEMPPEDFLRNPTAVAAEPRSTADRHALNYTVGDAFLAKNVRQARRRAAELSPAERFDFLASWILPGRDHPTFRVTGEFTPADPSRLAMKLENARFDSASRGGEIVSPVFDLLAAAAQTGRLKDLQARIASASEPEDHQQRRAHKALLSLASLEAGEEEAFAAATASLHRLAVETMPKTMEQMWPEMLVIHWALQRDKANVPVGELLGGVYSHLTARSLPQGGEDWHARMTWLMERYRRLTASEPGSEDATAGLEEWISVQRISARTRGEGFPHPLWRRNENNEVHHVRGHHEDYLFYRSPLRGNFEVAGEMGIEATTQFLAAGKYFGPRWELNKLETGGFREGWGLGPLEPPLGYLGPWIGFRAVFRDRHRTIYLNGREVHSEALPENHDPWIGIRAWSRAVAKFRNVQFVGDAHIPDHVPLSASPQLLGWVPYYDEPAGHADAVWRHVEHPDGTGEIRGRRREGLERSFCEGLLTYQRPLVKGGIVEYDFFYEPGAIEAHAALDRLAFVVTPQGVRVHAITDGRFDRTDVPPDNLCDEPQSHRVPTAPLLRPGDWNHMQVMLDGGAVALRLNGQPVFERDLELANRRVFGLFHFADQTELRVRNVVLRGAWPTTLRSVSKQELADARVTEIDADLPKLKSVFTHDFARQGLPERFFKPMNSDGRGEIDSRSDGLHMARPGAESWTSVGVRLPFSAVGDFDVEATFDQLSLQAATHSCIMLLAEIDDDQKHECRLLRMLHRDNHHEIDPSLSVLHPSGARSYSNDPSSCEALSGRLRVARRGNKAHYLFAEGDSQAFRWIGAHTVTERPLTQEGFELSALANGLGETRVVWKSVTLRAEQLKYLPPHAAPVKHTLHVMTVSDGDLRELAKPPRGFTHLGSPEWSSNGAKVAFDMSQGSTTTSHIAVINADGSQLKDLGPGCMPSFSRDGRRIVFSQPGRGIVLMQFDGSKRETLDANGWGAQWSPDGGHIAYGKSGNISIYDVKTGQQRLLLTGEPAARYGYIYWNLGWSHDSQWIAFKAQNRKTRDDELAVARTGQGGEFRVLRAAEGYFNADVSWSPDNQQVLFTMQPPAASAPKLVLVDRVAPKSPGLLPHQPDDRAILDCDWSPDGRQIVFSSQSKPQSVNWPLEGDVE